MAQTTPAVPLLLTKHSRLIETIHCQWCGRDYISGATHECPSCGGYTTIGESQQRFKPEDKRNHIDKQ